MKKNKLPYKSSSFRVPGGYFENLTERITGAVTSPEEKGLPELEKRDPFKVPDQYFPEFSKRLLEKIEQEKKPSKVVPLFKKEIIYYVAGVAAVVVAMLSIDGPSPEEVPTGIDSIEITALENYLDQTMEYSSDVFHVLGEEQINVTVTDTAAPAINREAILEYLNENIEETAIIFTGN